MNSDIQTDRQIDKQTDRHTDRQTVRQTMINRVRECKTVTLKSKSHWKAKCINSGRQIDRQTERQTDRLKTVRQARKQIDR